jgi:hypothetical protein
VAFIEPAANKNPAYQENKQDVCRNTSLESTLLLGFIDRVVKKHHLNGINKKRITEY